MDIAPVEYVIIEFPENRFTGEIAPALADVVERGVVRILDLVFVSKDAGGDVSYFEYDELDDLVAFAAIEGDADGLLNDTDIGELAAELTPDSSALFIVWEDAWASDLATAVRGAGGRVVGGSRIPHEVVQGLLEGLDD